MSLEMILPYIEEECPHCKKLWGLSHNDEYDIMQSKETLYCECGEPLAWVGDKPERKES